MDEHPGRLAALDGLRGAAILLVLGQHFTVHGFERPASGTPLLLFSLAQGGWIGVDLFFVLSGFLITGVLYRAKGTRFFFRNFYARRTLRIFPLYFGFLAIAVVLLPQLLPQSARLAGWARESPWYWTYTSNLLIAAHGWSEQAVQGLNHFWSLAVEEQFYLLWPLAVFFLDRRALLRLCVAAAVVSLALRAALASAGFPIAAYVLMPARIDSLAAGAFVALVLHGPTPAVMVTYRARQVFTACAVALVAIALARRTPNPEDTLIVTLGYSCLAGFFASALAIAVSSRTPIIQPLLRSAILRMFGRYSYGLYVVHHAFLFVLPPSAVALALADYLPPGTAKAAALSLLFALCLATAATSWHLFEEPILRLKRRFEEPTAPASGAVAAPVVAS